MKHTGMSKTARRSSIQQDTRQLTNSSELPRLVSMGEGRYAVLRNPVTRQDEKYETNSFEFTEAMMALGTQWHAKLLAEITTLANDPKMQARVYGHYWEDQLEEFSAAVDAA